MPNDLDRAMALVLSTPTSGNVRRMIREVRIERASLTDVDSIRTSEDLHSDLVHLHRTALVLESDPEIVKRNTMARVFSAIAPVVDAFQEIRTFHQKEAFEIFSDVVQILSEVEAASQYLAAAELSAESHFSENMLDLELRLCDMVEMNGVEIPVGLKAVTDFMDSIRGMEMPLEAKPFVPFILWALLVTADYKLYRALSE